MEICGLTTVIGVGLAGLGVLSGGFLLVSGFTVEIIVGFRLKRAHSELKTLEREHLKMQTELAELRAALHRKMLTT